MESLVSSWVAVVYSKGSIVCAGGGAILWNVKIPPRSRNIRRWAAEKKMYEVSPMFAGLGLRGGGIFAIRHGGQYGVQDEQIIRGVGLELRRKVDALQFGECAAAVLLGFDDK